MRRRLHIKLTEHFELVLTVSGILVAIGLTVAGLSLTRERQAFVFLVWLQGFILWAVRRHSQLGRRQLLARARLMLQDRVNNQLTIILSATELNAGADATSEAMTADGAANVALAVAAARTITRDLAQLSLESLESWEARYGDTAGPLAVAPMPAPTPSK